MRRIFDAVATTARSGLDAVDGGATSATGPLCVVGAPKRDSQIDRSCESGRSRAEWCEGVEVRASTSQVVHRGQRESVGRCRSAERVVPEEWLKCALRRSFPATSAGPRVRAPDLPPIGPDFGEMSVAAPRVCYKNSDRFFWQRPTINQGRRAPKLATTSNPRAGGSPLLRERCALDSTTRAC